eukprot:UC1_evm1s742
MATLDAANVAALEAFVAAVRADTALLHDDRLAFFRAYLEDIGATVPPAPPAASSTAPGPEHTATAAAAEEEEEAAGELPPPELDTSMVVDPLDTEDLPMGDARTQATDAQKEEARSLFSAARETLNSDPAAAVEKLTQAISLDAS